MPEVLLHRLIAPLDADPRVVPLYVEPGEHAGGSAVRPIGRGSFEVAAGESVSFGTCFNAFPAAYWARWTDVTTVRLTVVAEGSGTIDVHRSDASGLSTCISSHQVGGDAPFVVDVPLDGMAEGGWIWFDAAAGDRSMLVASGHYSATAAAPYADARDAATLGITTFNRPDYCLALLGTLASRLHDLDCVDQVVVVDQGTSKVADQPGFPEIARAFGGRLRVIDQPNLGGSGGFARAMLESLASERSRYVLLLDDDIVIEPESVVRTVRFADHCRQPTIVGGHMLSMTERASLHSFGEDIDMGSFWWGPADGVESDHDFATQSLRHTSWMHRRVDVGYNGWWLCLIPSAVLSRIGLSQPFFIKWDDAEYGLRASEFGVPTATLPGAAVWHVPWTDKDDALDWQAYYHQRNRVVAALLHSDRPRGGGLVLSGLAHQTVHILAMQYSTAALRLKAVSDIERGPRHLHPTLQQGLTALNRLRSQYPDGQRGDVADAPSLDSLPALAALDVEGPSKASLILWGLAGAAHQVRRVDPSTRRRPQVNLETEQARWWVLARLDSARVSTRQGGGTVWYRRDRATAWRLFADSLRAYGDLWRRWPELTRQYRIESVDVTSPEAWRRTLEIDPSVVRAT